MFEISLLIGFFIFPLLGLLFIAIKRENDRKERMLREAIKALRIIAISRGRHL